MAMSYGVPVIATHIAIEGMQLNDGVDVLVAESIENFAEAVQRLVQDEALWVMLSANGLENVRQHFSFEAAAEALRRAIG
jgi:glycosyltransferase involved in cell wall biosynthesis